MKFHLHFERLQRPALALALTLAAGPAIARNVALEFLDQPERGQYQLNVSKDFAKDNIQRGYGLLQTILDGNHDGLTDRQTDGLDVVAVMWALYDAAAQKGQAYDQGSFMVEDRDGHLFQFLLGNHEAVARHSSHLHKASRLTQAGHYGIDILGRYQPGERTWTPHSDDHPNFVQQNILPAQKGTILFIPMAADSRIGLEVRHVFIKMEDHGLRTWHGYANHAWDFITGTLLKLKGGQEVARKERIDPRFTQAYQAMLEKLEDQHRSTLDPHAADLGLRVMRAQAVAVKGLPAGQEAHRRADAFIERVDASGLDHLNVRTGGEVVLPESELRHGMAANGIQQATQQASLDWVIDMPKDLPEVLVRPRSPRFRADRVGKLGDWAK